MREGYAEWRKQYKKEYRIKNRVKAYAYFRKWYWEKRRKIRNKKDGEFCGDCAFGRKWELEVLKLLPGAIDCNTDSFHHPYDIEWNGWKIDIKAANPRAVVGGYNFYTKPGKWKKVDYYLCLCILDNKIDRAFMVPSKIFRTFFYVGKRPTTNTKYKIELTPPCMV